MELKGKKILFLGDSITEGVGASCPENAYWRVFGRNTQAEVWADGRSGTRIAPQLRPDEWDSHPHNVHYGARVADMPAEADGVVVFGGTNDFGHGDAPLGKMSDREETSFYGALHQLCQALIAKYPLAEIVLFTPLHRLGEDAPINERGIRNVAPLSGYAAVIREVAAYYGLPVLDLYATSGIQPRVDIIRQAFAPDGLHPNDAGHARIARRLEGFLNVL